MAHGSRAPRAHPHRIQDRSGYKPCRGAPIGLAMRALRGFARRALTHTASRLTRLANKMSDPGAPVGLPLGALRVIARRAHKARRVAVAVLVHHGRERAFGRRHARQQRSIQQAHLCGRAAYDPSFMWTLCRANCKRPWTPSRIPAAGTVAPPVQACASHTCSTDTYMQAACKRQCTPLCSSHTTAAPAPGKLFGNNFLWHTRCSLTLRQLGLGNTSRSNVKA